MSQTKVIKLLKTFTENEFKEFEKFIESPYFSPGRDLKPLYHALKKYYPDFNFSFEEIYKHIHPSDKFDTKSYNILSTLFSDLFILAEKFLFELSLNKHYIEYKTLLSREYIDRDLIKLAKKNLSEGFKALEGNKLSAEYFYHKYLLYEPYHTCEEYSGNDKNEIKVIQKLEKSFVLFMISKSIDFLDLLETYRYNLNFEPEPFLLKNILSNLDINSLHRFIKRNKFEHADILVLYLQLLELLLNINNESVFHKFRLLHKKYYKRLSDYENFKIYTMLELCADTLRSTDSMKYLKELFVIQKEKIGGNYYKPEGVNYIHPAFYRSVLLAAIALKQINWAEKFVKIHTEELPEEYRESLLLYAKAKLYFCRKEYSKSLDLLSRMKPKWFLLKYDIKQLTIQIFYELGYEYELRFQIDAFRHFLRTNKNVTEVRKEWYLNFIRFVQELLKQNENPDNYELNKLVLQLNTKKNIAGELWLKEKISALIK